MTKKAISLVMILVLALGLCPGAALAAEYECQGADVTTQSVAVSTQETASEWAASFVAACDELPSASDITLADHAKVLAASKFFMRASTDMLSSLTKEETAAVISANENKLEPAEKAIDDAIASAKAATKKAKVSGVSVKAGKKSVTVSWKKMSGKCKYSVFYSTKKTSGYSEIATTSKNKAKVKGLQSGKKYYFKVRATRTDIPMSSLLSTCDDVDTKFSAVKTATVK